MHAAGAEARAECTGDEDKLTEEDPHGNENSRDDDEGHGTAVNLAEARGPRVTPLVRCALLRLDAVREYPAVVSPHPHLMVPDSRGPVDARESERSAARRDRTEWGPEKRAQYPQRVAFRKACFDLREAVQAHLRMVGVAHPPSFGHQ